VDLGSAWINDTDQSEIYSLSQKYGLEMIEQRVTGLSLQIGPNGVVQSQPYGGIMVSGKKYEQ